MKFTKMQGAGNDFVLMEAGPGNTVWSDIASAVCDRHYGIGADGLLVLMPSEQADFCMRIFNADGTESDVCGNGLRCMIRFYLDTHASSSVTGDILVETRAGIRKAGLIETADGHRQIQTRMGKPRFAEQEIPLKNGASLVDIKELRYCEITAAGENLKLNVVSMGNPHAVCFTQMPVDDYPLSVAGPVIATADVFPDGTNFEIARVIDRKTIETRVWERGVGETLACGSGACAVTVAAIMKGYADSTVNIVLPGGTLTVGWDGTGEVFLSGPAEPVFTGEWPE